MILQCLPEEAANELLRRLLEQRRVGAPQLELFRFCATSVHLAGPAITPAWLAYLGDYPALRELRLERCPRLRDEHLRHLQTLAPTLQTLSLSGCGGLGGGAGGPLAALTRLRALDLSGTSVGEGALLQCLPALPGLTSLSLADVAAASDAVCEAAGGALSGLQRLVLSATAVGDAGVSHLERLSRLTALDLSLTQVGAGGAAPWAGAWYIVSHAARRTGQARASLACRPSSRPSCPPCPPCRCTCPRCAPACASSA